MRTVAILLVSLLAGCAQSASGTLPQSAIAQSKAPLDLDKSWMPEQPAHNHARVTRRPIRLDYTADRSLIFEADQYGEAVNIYRTVDARKDEPPITQIPTGGDPFGLAMDKSGTLYVAQYEGWSVSEYPKGQTIATKTITDGLHSPDGVAVDKHGTLFVSNNDPPGWISVYPRGSSTPSEIISGGGLTDPFELALDKKQNLYVADFGANQVFEIPAGTETVKSLGLQDCGDPTGIAIDQRTGYIWVTSNGQVNVYALGSTTPSKEITGFRDAYAISIQDDGTKQGTVAVADSNADLVDLFKPGSYTPYASFGDEMEDPTGILIEKPQ
jgi:hypothetical protein